MALPKPKLTQAGSDVSLPSAASLAKALESIKNERRELMHKEREARQLLIRALVDEGYTDCLSINRRKMVQHFIK